MTETFHESRYTGAYIDDQIEQVGKNTSSIAGLADQLNKISIEKADKAQIPTSISDLVHDAALVYVGDKAPEDSKYDVWVYLSNDLKRSKIYSRTRDGAWIDTSPATYEMFKVGFRIEKLESGDTNVDCSEKLRDIRNAMDNEQLPIGYELDTHKTFLLQSFSPAYVLFSCVSKDEDGQSVTENIEYIENQGWVYSATPVSSDISGGVQEIYVGSGDMPEGYVLQIDPEGDGIADAGSDELYSLAYYGDINIKPSDSSLFEFTTDDTTMTASIKAKSTDISGDIVIPYEYVIDGKVYKVARFDTEAFYNSRNLTSVTIPNSITSIGEKAFMYCEALTSVIIPNSITSIGKRAFEYCEALTSVKIPDSVRVIKPYAFYGCTNLQTVYYEGTNGQWGAVSVSDFNDPLINATIRYDWTDLFVVEFRNAYEEELSYVPGGTLESHPQMISRTVSEIVDAINNRKMIFGHFILDGKQLLYSSSYSMRDVKVVDMWTDEVRTVTEVEFVFAFENKLYRWKSNPNLSDAYENRFICWNYTVENMAAIEYVDNAVADAEEIVYINAEEVNGIITSDMDYNKAFEVINEGKTLVVKLISGTATKLYTLSNVSNGCLEFSNIGYTSSKTLIYWSFGAWENIKYQFATVDFVDAKLASITPVKGVDYWTEEDKAEIKTYVDDAILGGAW